MTNEKTLKYGYYTARDGVFIGHYRKPLIDYNITFYNITYL